jgi:hypothetical protein
LGSGLSVESTEGWWLHGPEVCTQRLVVVMGLSDMTLEEFLAFMFFASVAVVLVLTFYEIALLFRLRKEKTPRHYAKFLFFLFSDSGLSEEGKRLRKIYLRNYKLVLIIPVSAIALIVLLAVGSGILQRYSG